MPPPDFFLRSGAGRVRGFLGEMVGWVDFYGMWFWVDVWSIVFQTDRMVSISAKDMIYKKIRL